MGRLPRAYLVFAAALGWSGCLLFTDPINKAPDVTITAPPASDPVVRDERVDYTATVTDDKDSQGSMLVDWAEFTSPNQPSCLWVTAALWASKATTSLAVDVPYPFKAQSLDIVCLCARATDHNGASGQACRRITPVNSTPVAQIVDVAGYVSGQMRPLCSPQVHLSAEYSTFPTGDELQSGEQLQFNWSLQYSGTDAAGKSVQLSTCAGIATGKSDQHRCFNAVGPGTETVNYTVTLSITDSVVSNGVTTKAISDPPASFVIPVNVDTPPCIQRTDPDVHAQRILLSRNADLGGSYQSRTFRVLNAADDCEAFPLPAGSTNLPTQFVWSVLNTQASPNWSYQTNTSDSFTVSQASFPNARPGDTIQVRVEARDTPVQKLYQAGGQVCSTDTVDICCGSVACSGSPNDCIRWTTWTVQFQP